MKNRIKYGDDGKLDEVVTDGGAHLEYLGGRQWFLSCLRADGSAFSLWFEGKILDTEEQPAPTCKGCGEAIPLHVPCDGPYLKCPACGWSAREALGNVK